MLLRNVYNEIIVSGILRPGWRSPPCVINFIPSTPDGAPFVPFPSPPSAHRFHHAPPTRFFFPLEIGRVFDSLCSIATKGESRRKESVGKRDAEESRRRYARSKKRRGVFHEGELLPRSEVRNNLDGATRVMGEHLKS